MPRSAHPRIHRNHFVTDAGGKRKVLCHVSEGLEKAKSELRIFLGQLEQERKDNGHRIIIPYTAEECAAEFVESKQSTRKPRTFEDYVDRLRRFIKWYGKMEVSQIRLKHGEEYFQLLQEEGLSAVSINRHIQSAKSVFNHAVKHGWLKENPWTELEMLLENQRTRVVTDEEFDRLIAACDTNHPDGILSAEENSLLMKEILWVLRLTALRPGELRILRWDHLRADEREIAIPPNEHKTGTTRKNPEWRRVPYLEDAETLFARRRLKYSTNRWVFPNPDGNQLQDDALSKRFARLRTRAGLDAPDPNTGEMICLYSLRHTRLTEAGTKEKLSPYLLSAYAGHSVKMTERYVHPNAKLLAAELQRGRERRLNP